MGNSIPKDQQELMVMHLNKVDPIILTQRIKAFRKLNLRSMSNEEIRNEIRNVLLWDNLFVYYPNIKEYSKGTVFFRVRRLKSNTVPISNFCKYSDFWEPPEEVIRKYGRINKPGESLLYTTPADPTVPLYETHVKEGEWYALIQYVAVHNIKENTIGGEYDYSVYGIEDKNAILINELYNDFLQTEFSRDVGDGTEYLYRVSEVIAKDYFDLPPRDVQDAWAYSSVQDKGKYNVCFRPDIAHEVLSLTGAMICKKGKDDRINVYCVALPSDNLDAIELYSLGTDIQKKMFPDIVMDNK